MSEKYKSKYGVPKPNDMMVTGVGTLGICYIVKDSDEFYFKDGNTLWFKNKNLCNVRFIYDQYNTDFVREQIDSNANASTMDEKTILDTKYQLLTDELNDINEELDRYGGIDINDTVVKTRFDLIRNELKKFEDGDFEVTGELLHSFVNKILVEDIQHIIYLIT